MPKRLRLLIYEHATEQQLVWQRDHDAVHGRKQFGDGSKMKSITSIELNPGHITIMELLRLFRRESSTPTQPQPSQPMDDSAENGSQS